MSQQTSDPMPIPLDSFLRLRCVRVRDGYHRICIDIQNRIELKKCFSHMVSYLIHPLYRLNKRIAAAIGCEYTYICIHSVSMWVWWYSGCFSFSFGYTCINVMHVRCFVAAAMSMCESYTLLLRTRTHTHTQTKNKFSPFTLTVSENLLNCIHNA